MKSQKLIAFLVLTTFALTAGVGCSGIPTLEVVPQETTAPEVVQATGTAVPPTDTPVPDADTPIPAVDTPASSTDTPVSADALESATGTPAPATATLAPADTPEAAGATPQPALDTATSTPMAAAATSTPMAATASPAQSFYQQGSAFFEQQEWDQAIAQFQKALEADPAFVLAYMGLGYSYAGKAEYGPAIQNLEKYLELAPEAGNRAQVEAFLNQLQSPGFDVPPGKALFVFYNYSDSVWNIDIGPHFLQVPAREPGQEYRVGTIAIDPGTYTWQGHTPDGDYYITGPDRNKAFEFTVEAGDAHLEGVR